MSGDTNKFHILPNSILKKFKFNEKLDSFSLDLSGEQIIKKSINKFYFDFREVRDKLRLPEKESKDFHLIMNTLEDIWNESNFEDSAFEYINSMKDKIKKNNSKFEIVKDNEMKKIRTIWSRMTMMNKEIDFMNLTLNTDITNMSLHSLSILFDVPEARAKFLARTHNRLKTKSMKQLRDSYSALSRDHEERVKKHSTHWMAKDINSHNNNSLCMIFSHKQPLYSTPFIKIPPELIREDLRRFCPSGYEVYQLNPRNSLIVIDTLDMYVGHNKIEEEISEMCEEEFEYLKWYLYFNSFQTTNKKLFSMDKDILEFFVHELERFEKENYVPGIVLDISEYEDYLSDFNISSTIRNENFYIPLEEEIRSLSNLLTDDEYSLLYFAHKILPPANYLNKTKTLEMMEIIKLFKNELIDKRVFNELILNWFLICKSYVEENLQMEFESYMEIIQNRVVTKK